jgi:A/G-specific adenine glycosylase
LSEIMLQQTQVVTVQNYFSRFLQHFPDVQSLAQASLEDVLVLWSGLGYYSRARNLHRCAIAIVHQHQGVFPKTAHELEQLPGIGPSTAAAIASLCHQEQVAIFDGNVKRVLSRFFAFSGDLSTTQACKNLQHLAQTCLPQKKTDMPAYTQGIMDLGATLCTLKKPRCTECPVRQTCQALQQKTPERFPVKTRKVKRSSLSWWLLIMFNRQNQVFLCQRPAKGIWAGLHCFPVFESEAEMLGQLDSIPSANLQQLVTQMHALTHRDLHLHAQIVKLENKQLEPLMQQHPNGRWFSRQACLALGLPAPIRSLLELHHPAPDGV